MAEKKSTTKGATSKKGTKSTKSKFDGILVCTTSHLAEMYGISERQIYNQINSGVAVKVGANKFDCVKSVQNYIGKMREIEEIRKQTPEEIKIETEVAKLEHERLKARKTELLVLEMEGKLHYEEDVKALWNNIVVAAKSKLASIGVKLAPQLRGETDEGIIQEHIDREVYEALKEISEYNADDFEQELLGRLEDEGEAESEDN
jgi:hypothetical protein